MKYICIVLLLFLLLAACHRKITLHTVTMYQETYSDKDGNPELLGIHLKEDLQQPPYGAWYNKNYADYAVDSVTIGKLRPMLPGKQFEIFMGTWCDDCKMQVPRMLKILDYAGVPGGSIKLIMVDNHDSTYKQSPAHEQIGKGIHRIPDLIVYNGKEEVNRIIESPVTTIEKDLLAILSTNTYQPNYKGAAYLAKLTREKNVTEIRKDSALVLEQLRPLLQQSNELNTLGLVWMMSGETSEALLAYQLNAALFPGTVQVFESLGRINVRLNNKDEARKNYRSVLTLEPGNTNAAKMIMELR